MNTESVESPATLMTIPEVAVWLHVKEATIRKMVCYGRIPYLKIGRLVRFDRRAVGQRFGLDCGHK